MANFGSFTGTLIRIENAWSENRITAGCSQQFSVVDQRGEMVNFITTPSTYFLNHIMLEVGTQITGFYDANAPVPLIYPPQYRAVVMARYSGSHTVFVDHFDRQLVSSDGSLKLNISPATDILLTNGQRFTGNPANKTLVVVYSVSTRSIPAQTTPSQIVVLCP